MYSGIRSLLALSPARWTPEWESSCHPLPVALSLHLQASAAPYSPYVPGPPGVLHPPNVLGLPHAPGAPPITKSSWYSTTSP